MKLNAWELEKHEILKLKTAELGQIIEMVSKNKKQWVQNWLFTDKLAWPRSKKFCKLEELLIQEKSFFVSIKKFNWLEIFTNTWKDIPSWSSGLEK